MTGLLWDDSDKFSDRIICCELISIILWLRYVGFSSNGKV